VSDRNITSALDVLVQAKEAFRIQNYKEATRVAGQAENQIEDYKEQFEEKLEEEEERDIEVKIKGNQAKTKVEVDGIKARFILETSNRDEIVSEIASRTGLSISEVKNIMKIDIEELEEEIEIEVGIKKGVANIKLKINETESEFALNTTDKEEIISETMKRTGLAREQVEKNAEFEVKEEKLEEAEEIEKEEKEKENKENVEEKKRAEKETEE
jgi:hypothetical protein